MPSVENASNGEAVTYESAEISAVSAVPPKELSWIERQEVERAEQAGVDAEILRGQTDLWRRAHAARQGWGAARMSRALDVLALDEEPQSAPESAPAVPRTKADRALAVLRSLPICRGAGGVVLISDAEVVSCTTRAFAAAVQAAWCAAYPDETLSATTTARALATLSGDPTLPTTDRAVPDPIATLATGEPDDRPAMAITTDLESMTDATVAALACDERMFQRAGELVHVTSASDPSTEDRAPLAEGTPVIRSLALATLRERTASALRWIRRNANGDERSALPPDAVVAAVQARAQWEGIRHLLGIVESPTMRPDGTLLQTPGYDQATGYIYAPNAEFPRVKDRPSQADAVAALAELSDVWVDFPFESDAARMVPIAMLLTILVRPAIEGATPAFGFDANTRGTGKDLAATSGVELGTGRAPPLATFPTGRDGSAEIEKMLGAYALSGARVVYFGNVAIGTVFGGASIEKVITCEDKVSLRRLGQSEAPELPWRAVVIVSGNNLTVADETARRVLSARMVSPVERPEERTGWKHPELLKHVRAQRPRLVSAALTIVRAYVVAGRPDVGTMSLGSFEAWSRLIPPAIRWAGGADVLGARVTLTGDNDEATVALATILVHLHRLLEDQPGGLSANAILSALYPGPKPHEPPDGWDELRRSLESATGAKPGGRPDTHRLGTYLKGHRDRKIDGKALVVLGTHARANRWGVR